MRTALEEIDGAVGRITLGLGGMSQFTTDIAAYAEETAASAEQMSATTQQTNAATQEMEKGMPIPVVITAYNDRTFTFITKKPPNTYWIKKAIKLDKGSAKPHSDKVGKITREQLEEIAKVKVKDLTAANMDAAVRTIAGSARSMGITVEGV